jgi:hypothetical protein
MKNPVSAPTIYINKRRIVPVGDHHNMYGGSNGIQISLPAKITMSSKKGAQIRYTLNGKKVNLGSKRYRSAFEIYSNGDGFTSGMTTIKAKAYLDGDVSSTTTVVINVEPQSGSVYATGLTFARNAERNRGDDMPSNWPTVTWAGRTKSIY